MVCYYYIYGLNDFSCILVIPPLYMRRYTVQELVNKNVNVIVCNIQQTAGNIH